MHLDNTFYITWKGVLTKHFINMIFMEVLRLRCLGNYIIVLDSN